MADTVLVPTQIQPVGNWKYDPLTGTWTPITADDLAGTGGDVTLGAVSQGDAGVDPWLVTGTVTATGPLTDTELRATPVPVSGTVAVTGADTSLLALESGGVLDDILTELGQKTEPANQQHVIIDSSASIATTGPLTDTQLRATPVPITDTLPGTSAVTLVAGNASSVTLLALNANRLGATIWNNSTAILYVKFGTTASTVSCTVKMIADAYYEVPFKYTGRIDGIWASATGAAYLTELTA